MCAGGFGCERRSDEDHEEDAHLPRTFLLSLYIHLHISRRTQRKKSTSTPRLIAPSYTDIVNTRDRECWTRRTEAERKKEDKICAFFLCKSGKLNPLFQILTLTWRAQQRLSRLLWKNRLSLSTKKKNSYAAKSQRLPPSEVALLKSSTHTKTSTKRKKERKTVLSV